ncbi:unnamed protein product [Sphagnum balticum]
MDRGRVSFGSSSDDLITTPLVSGNNGNGISNVGSSSNNGGRTRGIGSGGSGSRSSGVQGAARYLRRAGSRGVMREPSVLVRESAAEHLEERQNDWAYSRPVVVLDLIWNLAFLLVALAVVILSKDERPRVPLRLWITGYALQCIVHMVCVSLEYRRRRQPQQLVGASSSSSTLVETSASQDAAQAVQDAALDDNVAPSLAKQLESGNTMFSFVWWMFGFGLIISGGEVLIREAPHLYWLCIVFLAFDVLFVVFCIALAFVIGIAVCCCLPCIIAILYAVAEEKGASEEEINALAIYKFRRTGSNNSSPAKSAPFSGVMSLMGTSDRVTERTIAGEDAECCICLSQYEDGVEVREIPCSHHFHATCVDKWLRINATCPLCKHNIIHGNNNINNRRQEEV